MGRDGDFAAAVAQRDMVQGGDGSPRGSNAGCELVRGVEGRI